MDRYLKNSDKIGEYYFIKIIEVVQTDALQSRFLKVKIIFFQIGHALISL